MQCNISQMHKSKAWVPIIFCCPLSDLLRFHSVGRECKMLLIEFFNSLEKIAQSLEFNNVPRSQNIADDSGPVDWPCTDIHIGRKE